MEGECCYGGPQSFCVMLTENPMSLTLAIKHHQLRMQLLFTTINVDQVPLILLQRRENWVSKGCKELRSISKCKVCDSRHTLSLFATTGTSSRTNFSRRLTHTHHTWRMYWLFMTGFQASDQDPNSGPYSEVCTSGSPGVEWAGYI